ncbi:hypothetical protein LTR84_004912 [Exophiala bonariae]|uniref:Uncharacterized protein n=1 Tax=Exophiala bonariae TaxID=1690606 RepID=A0AAV9NQT9_9EURO|nr:hypothetical protein LTR84_004912 [Exophiala bonariae]
MPLKSIRLFLAAALLTTGLPGHQVVGAPVVSSSATEVMTASSLHLVHRIPTTSTLIPTKTLYGPAATASSSNTKINNAVASLDPKTGQETLWMALGPPYGKKHVLEATYPVRDLPIAPIIDKTCVRTALAALAKYRETCCHDPQSDNFHRAWCSFAPTVEKCCGEYIPYNQSEYLNYPTYKRRYEEATPKDALDKKYPRRVWYEEVVGFVNATRMIIQHEPEAYRTRNIDVNKDWEGTCEIYAPQFDKEYWYWMWKLNKYAIEDADENGKVLGLEKWGPDNVIYDFNTQWRTIGSVCPPIYKNSTLWLDLERMIVKDNWHW